MADTTVEDSIFSKIIRGDIPSHKVYEDDRVYAFLDIFASQPGYTLVVPKVQVASLWDLDDEDYAAVMAAAKLIARRQREVLAVPFVGVKVVGIDVPHAHVHLVPFHDVEGYRTDPDPAVEPDHAALAVMAERLAL
jgi:histidine triad (HIT) family protein